MNDNGSIIFSGSVHTYLGQPGVAAYAATKGGLVSMARSIAADLAPRKIRVNVVAPGATKTPSGSAGRAPMPRQRNPQKFPTSSLPRFHLPVGAGRKMWPSPRFFLPRDDSSYINAVELMVDGGLTGAPFGAPILRG
jgi:NAD(P)-dependent dehydrogenase (short-subunit alcohol dehydrogenase family)